MQKIEAENEYLRKALNDLSGEWQRIIEQLSRLNALARATRDLSAAIIASMNTDRRR